jgi:hypothetical protein
MFNRNKENFSLIGPPKTQRLIKRPLLSVAVTDSSNLEQDSTFNQSVSSNSISTSPSINNSSKSLLDILNFDNNLKFLENNVINNTNEKLTVIPLNINTDNITSSEYECEYELSITKNEFTFDKPKSPVQKIESPLPNEEKRSISDEKIDLVVNFNPLLNMTFVPNELYKNKTTFTNSKSYKNEINNMIVNTTPEINIQITISETKSNDQNAANEFTKSSTKTEKQHLMNEIKTNKTSSSPFSSASSSSSSTSSSSFLSARNTGPKPQPENRNEVVSPILNKIFDLLDNSQYLFDQTSSNKSLKNTFTQTNSIEEEDEAECISAYEQIVRFLDASLDEQIKAHSLKYDYYGDDYETRNESELPYHKISELNNSQSQTDYYFEPNKSYYWLDSEPRKVQSIYDEIAHLLDNAHLLRMQKQQSFAYF